MATNYTTNYQLNQWEPNDQVLRTDFNADNAKLDAALHTVNSRRLQELQNFTVEEASNFVRISLEDIDWTKCRTLHLDIIPASGSSENLLICYCHSFLDPIAPMSTKWNHLILLPYGREDMPFIALVWTDSGSFFRAPTIVFSRLTDISVIGELGTYKLAVGSQIILRGEGI